jgi:hypothetical protein
VICFDAQSERIPSRDGVSSISGAAIKEEKGAQ